MGYQFNDTNDLLVIPAATSINTLSPFTVYAWVILITEPPASGSRVFSKGSALRRLIFLASGSLTRVKLEVDRVGSANAQATSDGVDYHELGIFIPRWLFVAATYSDTNGPRIYLGDWNTGVAEQTYASRDVGSGAASDDSAEELWIGGNGSGEGLGGVVDTFAYINSELSASQLLAAQFSPYEFFGDITQTTKALYSFDYNAPIPDLSGNGNASTSFVGARVSTAAPLGPPWGPQQVNNAIVAASGARRFVGPRLAYQR